jgi:hypothetical protein
MIRKIVEHPITKEEGKDNKTFWLRLLRIRTVI